jgi:putative peptide zinc metalloprotease protein
MTSSEQHAEALGTPERADGRSAQSPVVSVPDYPVLAPDVELLGEMQESGFKEPQCLVRRGERFVQVTELLYRVAEQADGKSTHEEMAEGVTRSTDWLVSAENVRQLLASKLLPLGIVALPEDVALQVPAVEERTTSPLRVNARTRLLGPGAIDPITRVLKILFAPPVLVPVLLIVALAHAWLYVVHGLGGAVQSVLYAPGLALPLLGILFVSGVFHEFGHAAALRYGGGRARGMGFGLYLVYPALYTDTTDSYRLGRWARVRTDLGGFYFHLIFALALVVLYLLTGWEFLLVAVLLINLDIVYQCLPFVRFDGYWALADITGIPDFFSQMGAFLRSMSPVSSWRRGNRLPDLKPWVRVVFAAYVMITVPVLSLLLYVLITRLPGIATTAWNSLLAQVAVFSQALDDGYVAGMALSVAQMLILGLQMLGITYLLYSLGRRLAGALWKRIRAAHQAEGDHV